jgi:LysM repeat protein
MRCIFKKTFRTSMLPALIVLVIIGCGPPREGSHPLRIKAATQIKIQKYDEAVKSLKQYLKVNPESGRTHQLLAQLYDENLNRPELAVYHYMLCLEEDPHIRGASDIRKFLASARKRAYNRLKKEYNDPKTVSDLSDKLERSKHQQQAIALKNKRLTQVVEAYKRHIYKLNREQRSLKLKFDAAKAAQEITGDKLIAMEKQLYVKQKELEALKTELKKLPASDLSAEETDSEPMTQDTEKTTEKPIEETKPEKPVAKTSTPAAEKTEEATPPKAEVKKASPPPGFPDIASVDQDTEETTKDRVYSVKTGDTLSSISRKFYGSSRHYNVILEANKNILPSAAKLKIGQTLKIPHLAGLKKK